MRSTTVGAEDITIRQGGTFKVNVAWYDEDGDPVAVAGYSAKAQVRPYKGHTGSPHLTMETNPKPGGGAGNGRIVIAGDGKSLDITVTDTDTAALTPWDSAVWDLILFDGSGVAWPLVEGRALFEKAVTVK